MKWSDPSMANLRPVILFQGIRTKGGCVVLANGKPLSATPSKKLVDYGSPHYDWGDQGSGPSQLSLAMLFHCLGDGRLARALHRDFLKSVACHWPKKGFQLSELEILRWVQESMTYKAWTENFKDD